MQPAGSDPLRVQYALTVPWPMARHDEAPGGPADAGQAVRVATTSGARNHLALQLYLIRFEVLPMATAVADHPLVIAVPVRSGQDPPRSDRHQRNQVPQKMANPDRVVLPLPHEPNGHGPQPRHMEHMLSGPEIPHCLRAMDPFKTIGPLHACLQEGQLLTAARYLWG